MKRIALLLAVSVGVFAISYSMSHSEFTDSHQPFGVADSTGGDSTAEDSGDSTVSSDKSAAPVADSSEAEAEVAPDTITTESGLKYIITREGEGAAAKPGQVVSMHYSGRLAETGREFDNSYKRQAPLEFPLGRGIVIKGWDEGITGMKVGEARTLIIPSNLGYGQRGAPRAGIPANATLIFDLELVAIK